LPVTLEQSEVECSVRLVGEINVASAAELKRVLMEALAPGKTVCVEMKNVTEIDVTALQLLWAARREAESGGVGFARSGLVPEAILAIAAEAGLEEFPVAMAETAGK
jgi:anti-anti-sigma factor